MNKNDTSPWLVLDVSYLVWRSFHAIGHLSHKDVSTTAIFGLLRDVVQFQDLHNTKRIVFCFDRGRSLRIREFPQYKLRRQDDQIDEKQRKARHEIRRQMQLLRREYLTEIGYKNVLSQHGYEADDIIASVCNRIATKQGEAIIIGSDKDLYQLLSPRVSLYNPRIHKMLTLQAFVKDYGISPTSWIDVKALAGCVTDGVPGIAGIGEKTAIKFLRGELKENAKAFQSIVKGNDIWQRNRNLVDRKSVV